jgi:hypothetical protein
LAPAGRRAGGQEERRPPIRFVASILTYALLWYASLRTAATTGGIANVAAKAILLILTSLACILIGFFLPMTPVFRLVIGSAFWAGLLATAGALVGMGVSDAILARIEARRPGAIASDAAAEPSEKARRRF